jgi:predicted O-methyltransferase YrrM
VGVAVNIRQKINFAVRKITRHACLEDLSIEERRQMWPAAQTLSEKHLKNCALVESREKILEFLPQKSVCAELGIWKGEFSHLILETVHPAELHLIDIDATSIESATGRFQSQIKSGQVHLHLGDSAIIMTSMPDQYFDWVYVDADHSYPAVSNELKVIHKKLKPGGLIALNDYTFFGPSDFIKYGVMEAVNEFCLQNDYEFLYLALQGRGYFDVVLRRIDVS